MNSPTRTRRLVTVPMALALGAGLVLSGCGDDDSASNETTITTAAAESSTTQIAPAGELSVTGAWARTSPSMATAGAAYMEITNGSDVDDALVGVSVDASIAATAQIHQTSTAPDDEGEGDVSDEDMSGGMRGDTGSVDGEGDTSTSAGGSGGMMTMQEVEEIAVPAGETVVLEPGGYHVMLMDLVEPLEAGDHIELTLEFAEAGEIVVKAEVRDTAP